MPGTSIRTLLLMVVALLAASVIVDFAHMVLSVLVDAVLAAAAVYFVWRLKTSYDTRIRDLEAQVRRLEAGRPGLP